MADLVPAIEARSQQCDFQWLRDESPYAQESIGKWSVYRKEAADKDKKINRLLSQVKDMVQSSNRVTARETLFTICAWI